MHKLKGLWAIRIVCLTFIILSLYFASIITFTKGKTININNIVTIEESFVSIEKIDNGPSNAYILKTDNSKYIYYIWNEDLFEYEYFIKSVKTGDKVVINVYNYYNLEDGNGKPIKDYQAAEVCGLYTNQFNYLKTKEYITNHNKKVNNDNNLIKTFLIITICSGVMLSLSFIKIKKNNTYI